MAGFELQISGIGSDSSSHSATATAHFQFLLHLNEALDAKIATIGVS